MTTPSTSACGVYLAGCQHQLECTGCPDQAGKRVADPDVTATDTDLDELDTKARRGGGHPHVAGKGEGEPVPVGGSVDRGNHRLVQAPQLERQLGNAFLGPHTRARSAEPRCGRRGPDGGQIEPRAEPAPGASEDDDS